MYSPNCVYMYVGILWTYYNVCKYLTPDNAGVVTVCPPMCRYNPAVLYKPLRTVQKKDVVPRDVLLIELGSFEFKADPYTCTWGWTCGIPFHA